MPKKYSLLTVAAAAMAATLALTACGSSGGSDSSGSSAPATSEGKPVAGGVLKILLPGAEPRSLDPAALSATGATQDAYGAALYGTLIQGDAVTSKWTPSLATDFSTPDQGKTWTVKLRQGIVYSDGTPMTAADVVFNWTRNANPATGSNTVQDANTFTSVAVDDLTIKVTMKSQSVHFPTTIMETNLNYIAKPAALQAGAAAFDANPIGAGPFKIVSWKRADVLTLTKNDKYFDAPKPYLAGVEIRLIPDVSQRYNTLLSGAANFVEENNWVNVNKAKKNSDYQTPALQYDGGTALTMNNYRYPFNDVRARQAFAAALDRDQLDQAINGEATGAVPKTLFYKDSPYYADIPVATVDQKKAQDLFNAVAADTGKPVTFAITLFSATSQPVADSVITQMSQYKNVKVTVRMASFAEFGKINSTHDFDMAFDALTPTRMTLRMYSTSSGNSVGFKDPQMDAALDIINTTTDQTKVKDAWNSVQKILQDKVPYLLYTRSSYTVVAPKNIHGITHYGFGSVALDSTWMTQ